MGKERADLLLVRKGLVETREKAKRLIMAGAVKAGEKRIKKPSELIEENEELKVTETLPYVSRGGIKLAFALDHFGIEIRGKVVLDVGASTGGFTDCLIKRGAKKVYALDVGYGQLDWRLRKDPRVVPIERQNIRYFIKEQRPQPVDLITVDVSFISLKKVLPHLIPLVIEGGEILCLIKPQFEVGKEEVEKKGIIKTPEKHKKVVEEISIFAQNIGLVSKGIIPSPILGVKGNKEFFIYLVKPKG
ncbi:MAG: TlyA family RNA methyltransferase [Acidobacteria bacterium]|nr:TlyA family RNA methyltransferase [Acidobacteriota bacterium]